MKKAKSTLRTLWIILLMTLTCVNAYSVHHYLRIKIHGKNYDSLYIYGSDIDRIRFLIRGEKEGNAWLFRVPDSVYSKAIQGYSITHRIHTSGSTQAYRLVVNSIIDKDSIIVGLIFDDKYPDIDLTYLYNKKTNTSFVINESLIEGTLSDDNYFISFNKESDSYLHEKYPDVCRFDSDNDSAYIVRLKDSESIIKENPSSEYLMSRLFLNCLYAKNKNDLQRLFNHFSMNAKSTYWGNQVGRYISRKCFENMILPECKTGHQEKIVCNTDKYNLIIFSASWCGPCHRAIPALKKVYSELNDKLEMTYISLDEPNTMEEWKKLMAKENIPWRSLLSGNNVKIVREKYLAYGIPHMILVYPGRDMLMEVIEDDWENYLYQVMK